MTISSTNPFFIFGFIFFAVAFVYGPIFIEYLHAKEWKPSYFRQGIPLYQKHLHLNKKLMEFESYLEPLEEHLQQKHPHPPILFKLLSSNELAFRQEIVHGKKSDFRFFMHGLIIANPLEQQLSMIGYFSYHTISFSLLLIILIFWTLIASFGVLSYPTIGLVWTPFFIYSIWKSVTKCRAEYFNIEDSIRYACRDFIDSDELIQVSENTKPVIWNMPKWDQIRLSSIEIVLITILVALLALIAIFIGYYWLGNV